MFFIIFLFISISYYFISLLYYYYYIIFIYDQSRHLKMLRKLNIRCYSYQVKKQSYRMNGVRISTVNVSAKRVGQCFSTFLTLDTPTSA